METSVTPKEIYNIITKSGAEDEFREFIHNEFEENLNNTTGLNFKHEDSDRNNSNYYVVFSVNNKFYELNGYYDSWNGTSFDDYSDFYEVEKATRTIEYWKQVE